MIIFEKFKRLVKKGKHDFDKKLLNIKKMGICLEKILVPSHLLFLGEAWLYLLGGANLAGT